MMINFTELEKKMTSLGGAQKNPLCDIEESTNVRMSAIVEIERAFNHALPESYKHLYKAYGPFSFKKNIKVSAEELIPISDENRQVKVDYFYSLTLVGQCSVRKVLEQYSTQIPAGHLPICDGESGDLICINLNEKDFGKIYYWYHEALKGEEMFLLAPTFDQFFLSLQAYEEDNEGPTIEMKVDISPELLEMLRKSGLGPK